MLTNVTQVLTEQKLDSLMNSSCYSGCTCARCREDILAYALNHLPPHYVSTDKGILFEKANQYANHFDNDILPVLIRAVHVVEKSPRHNK